MVGYVYKFDIRENKLVDDCNFYPTEITKDDSKWLYARNNKYICEDPLNPQPENAMVVKPSKRSKWMISLLKDRVNAVWDKIKNAVAKGELWFSKVSTIDPEKPEEAHIIVIYTKDITDLKDIIYVLDYLESSGIRPPSITLKYKIDQQMCAISPWIHCRGKEKLCTFTLDAVRAIASTCHTYAYDICRNEVVSDCDRHPTDCHQIPPWLNAQNNMYTDEDTDKEKVGRWLLPVSKDRVNAIWDEIKMAVRNGELWRARVSTDMSVDVSAVLGKGNHIIMIDTKDRTDVGDVIRVLDFLESSGIKPRGKSIKYVKGQQSKDASKINTSFGKSWIYSSDFIRSEDSSFHDTYEYDILRKELVTDCDFCPSNTIGSDSELLYATNNTYPEETIDPGKIGKWTLAFPKNHVDVVWDKIKTAVTNGELWRSCVSTADPNFPLHIIDIYTKDYSNVDDVIRVLDCLESSGIKSRDQNIQYMKDRRSNADVQKSRISWLYSSNLIRSVRGSDSGVYEFDIRRNEVVTNSQLLPSATLNSDFLWLVAQNNKYTDEELDPEKGGKWMLFVSKNDVDAVWDQLKGDIRSGDLWKSLVSTVDPENRDDKSAIMIYTKDYTDLDDVIQVLDYLENSGLKSFNLSPTIKYKTEHQSFTTFVFQGGRTRPWIYSCDTIRAMGEFRGDTYQFDIHLNQLLEDCDSYPNSGDGGRLPIYPWLFARNNKYPDETVRPKKVGKWILFPPKSAVNTKWDLIKEGVKSGGLWCAKVSTFCKRNHPVGDSHTIMIYTKDFSDVQDVIQVLDYLENSGIKPRDLNIVYKTEEDTHKGYRWGVYHAGENQSMYQSRTIRNDLRMDLPWR